jgi:hypothetical protein
MANQHTGRIVPLPAIGAQFGVLTVVGEGTDRRARDGVLKRYIPVRCQCGQEREVVVSNLRTGNTKSCGRCLPRAPRSDIILAGIGERYGRTTILATTPDRISPNGDRRRFVQARCDCGTVFEIAFHSLRSGKTRSCGCAVIEAARTHGASGTPTFWAFHGMHSRCRGYTEDHARNYRDRGITVSPRWSGPDGFAHFLADMEEKPRGRWISVERIDNDGNYEPENCVWATQPVQMRNTRQNVWINYESDRLILKDACKTVGVRPTVVSKAVYRRGLTHQAAFDLYAYAATSTPLDGFYRRLIAALAWVRSRPWCRPATDATLAEMDIALALLR